MLQKVNLREKFSRLSKPWVPHVVGEVADQFVKVVTFEGEYVWHSHENEDEMFLVIEGEVVVQLRDGNVTLREGEFLVVPKGVEHRPVARAEAKVLLFEPSTTRNTGGEDHRYTIEPDQLERL